MFQKHRSACVCVFLLAAFIRSLTIRNCLLFVYVCACACACVRAYVCSLQQGLVSLLAIKRGHLKRSPSSNETKGHVHNTIEELPWRRSIRLICYLCWGHIFNVKSSTTTKKNSSKCRQQATVCLQLILRQLFP